MSFSWKEIARAKNYLTEAKSLLEMEELALSGASSDEVALYARKAYIPACAAKRFGKLGETLARRMKEIKRLEWKSDMFEYLLGETAHPGMKTTIMPYSIEFSGSKPCYEVMCCLAADQKLATSSSGVMLPEKCVEPALRETLGGSVILVNADGPQTTERHENHHVFQYLMEKSGYYFSDTLAGSLMAEEAAGCVAEGPATQRDILLLHTGFYSSNNVPEDDFEQLARKIMAPKEAELMIQQRAAIESTLHEAYKFTDKQAIGVALNLMRFDAANTELRAMIAFKKHA